MYRGRRYRLGDRRALERLEPFRRLGYELLRHAPHARGRRARATAIWCSTARSPRRGDIAFDFEFGSHGGIGPDELDQFMLHPAERRPARRFHDGGAVAAEQFYRFFAGRYGSDDDERDAQDAA